MRSHIVQLTEFDVDYIEPTETHIVGSNHELANSA